MVGTSSLRRAAQLQRKFPHLEFKSIVSFQRREEAAAKEEDKVQRALGVVRGKDFQRKWTVNAVDCMSSHSSTHPSIHPSIHNPFMFSSV